MGESGSQGSESRGAIQFRETVKSKALHTLSVGQALTLGLTVSVN